MRKAIVLFAAVVFLGGTAEAMDVHYRLSMPRPNSHYFEVKMSVDQITAETLAVKMPVWAPGSYLVREFAKHVNLVKAYDQSGKPLEVRKRDKNTWDIATKGTDRIEINYEVYAFEMSVRTSFLDDRHGYVNGTSVFMYIEQHEDVEGKLTVVPHPSFSTVTTALPHRGNNVFTFAHYDELVDCPIEIGNHTVFNFDASGVKHTVALYGDGNYDIPTLQKDMARIVEAESRVFGENPNDSYVFIIHNLTRGSGGLEHSTSTTLQVNRWTYDADHYPGFLSLVAHEYFHLWNVKRIRPRSLGPFDYDRENYTDLLWVMEGFTSYYDELILRRMGFYTTEQYMNKLVGTINYVENTPGSKVQPVAHASFDAWIKAYRSNENSANTTISYYSKGQILAAMLDLYIIAKFEGKKCLDHFMQLLWKDFYVKSNVGFTAAEFQQTLEKFLGEEMDWFFKAYVYSTEAIDYDRFFKGVGIAIANYKEEVPSLGISASESGGKLKVNSVLSGSAAEEQGISVNDEIIAVNGFRVSGSRFTSLLSTVKVGDVLNLLLSRDNIIETYAITVGEKTVQKYRYQPNFTPANEAYFNYWLRVDQ